MIRLVRLAAASTASELGEQKGGSKMPSKFDKRDPVTYEIIEHIGRLSTGSSGWSREVNIVAWNGRQARLDIRDWDPDHKKMSRGIGLNGTEVAVLTELLNDFDTESIVA